MIHRISLPLHCQFTPKVATSLEIHPKGCYFTANSPQGWLLHCQFIPRVATSLPIHPKGGRFTVDSSHITATSLPIHPKGGHFTGDSSQGLLLHCQFTPVVLRSTQHTVNKSYGYRVTPFFQVHCLHSKYTASIPSTLPQSIYIVSFQVHHIPDFSKYTALFQLHRTLPYSNYTNTLLFQLTIYISLHAASFPLCIYREV